MTFTMWSLGHLIFIVSPIIMTYVLYVLTKNQTMEKKRTIGIYLSIIAVVLLLLRNYEIWMNGDYSYNHEMVPLQICHLANFILLFAFWKRSNTAFTLAYTLNLITAFLSIIFADSLANYSNILTYRGIAYIVGHILIVVIIGWAFINNFIDLRIKTFLKSLFVIQLLVVASVVINNLMYLINGKYPNYFYTDHPEKGTPLETVFNFGQQYIYGFFKVNYVYVISMLIAFSLISYVLYVGGKSLKKIPKST